VIRPVRPGQRPHGFLSSRPAGLLITLLAPVAYLRYGVVVAILNADALEFSVAPVREMAIHLVRHTYRSDIMENSLLVANRPVGVLDELAGLPEGLAVTVT